MKAYFAAMMLCMAACTARVDQPMEGPEELTWRILAAGEYGRAANQTDAEDRREPSVLIARSQGQYETLWHQHVSEEEPPPAAFDEESVVFLLTGPRPTGGYSIDPRSVKLEGDTLAVSANVERPEPGRISSQAFTAPYAVVAVNDRSFGTVSWYQGGELVATQRLQPLQPRQ